MTLTCYQVRAEGDYLLSLNTEEARALCYYLADQLVERDPNQIFNLPVRFLNVSAPNGQATVFVSRTT